MSAGGGDKKSRAAKSGVENLPHPISDTGKGQPKQGMENLPHPIADTGKARDQVGKVFGVSGKSVDMLIPAPANYRSGKEPLARGRGAPGSPKTGGNLPPVSLARGARSATGTYPGDGRTVTTRSAITTPSHSSRNFNSPARPAARAGNHRQHLGVTLRRVGAGVELGHEVAAPWPVRREGHDGR